METVMSINIDVYWLNQKVCESGRPRQGQMINQNNSITFEEYLPQLKSNYALVKQFKFQSCFKFLTDPEEAFYTFKEFLLYK